MEILLRAFHERSVVHILNCSLHRKKITLIWSIYFRLKAADTTARKRYADYSATMETLRGLQTTVKRECYRSLASWTWALGNKTLKACVKQSLYLRLPPPPLLCAFFLDFLALLDQVT